jgi:dCMP deaminase
MSDFQHLFNTLNDYSERPSWEQYFILICKLISLRSSCPRLKVGCVLVRDNVIISTGYNGFPAGAPHVGIIRDEHEQMTIHAEINAIANASKRGVSTNHAICYVSHYPCINCAKALISAGIKEIKYIDDYKNDDLVSVICDKTEKKVLIKKV